MPTADWTMTNIVLNSHLLELDDIIKEHESLLLILIPSLAKRIMKIKSKFKPDSVCMTHTNLLVGPYLVLLLNLLCHIIFTKLSRQTFFTMSTSTISPVKFISRLLLTLETLPLQLILKVKKIICPTFPLITFPVITSLILLSLLSGLSRLCALHILFLKTWYESSFESIKNLKWDFQFRYSQWIC